MLVGLEYNIICNVSRSTAEIALHINFDIFYYLHVLTILWFGTCDAGTLTDKQ